MLSAKALSIGKARAKVVQRMLSYLPEISALEATKLALETSTWRTRRGTLLKPTARLNLLSALSSGFAAVTGRTLHTPGFKRAVRDAKAGLRTHIRKQAVPLQQNHLQTVLADTGVKKHIRDAIRFCWCLGLRAGDLEHIRRSDVLNQAGLAVGEKTAIIRMRGVKGMTPGARGYYRFLPLYGLALPLRKCLVNFRGVKGRLFKATRPQIVAALRRTDPRYTGHSLRRGVATLLAERGASTKQIRDHLGHQTSKSTRLYIQPSAAQRDAKRKAQVARLIL